jgi:hypothetical protein
VNDFSNYFNYFTEIEEHFQKARGTSLFLLSPLDWALIESWKTSGVPLEAVLIGIDTAFDKWRSRKSKTQQVNSLAFCSQAVLAAAQRKPGDAPTEAPAPFPDGAVRAYLEGNRDRLQSHQPAYHSIAKALDAILAGLDPQRPDLEALEQRLTILEEQMIAIARTHQTDEDAFQVRKELDGYLKAYRSKMSVTQISMLEKQYLHRQLLEKSELPRLSLFYLH